MANISDLVALNDNLKSIKQSKQTIEEQELIVENKFKANKRDNYIGPNGKGNPEIALEKGTGFNTKIGEGAFNHDVAYYKLGADGPLSAVFNTNTLGADRILLQVARNNPTAQYSALVRSVFTPIVGLKIGISNAYLFTTFYK